MAGNNSPSNGTQIHSDEMFADLVPAQCTERMEYYKTIVGCVPLCFEPARFPVPAIQWGAMPGGRPNLDVLAQRNAIGYKCIWKLVHNAIIKAKAA